ncbi:uncharacterized protein [Ptychodera flava]|uniref:uncharacterized protein n=1 Tax=Ptychodera flava TaxID=63121 RepID=UPI003969F9F4
MGVKRCAYPLCRSDSRYQHREYMTGVSFVRFPKPVTQPEKCDRWIRACCRADDFGRHRITQDTYVCSRHFVGGNGPTEDYPDPIPATARGPEVRIFEQRKVRPPPRDRTSPAIEKRRKIVKSRVTVNNENEGTVPSTSCQVKPVAAVPILSLRPVNTTHQSCGTPNPVSHKTPSPVICHKASQATSSKCDAVTQTDITIEHLKPYSDQALTDTKIMKRHMFMRDVRRNNKSCKFYTGLVSLQMLMYLFRWIQAKAERITLWKGESTSNVPRNKSGCGRALTTFEAFIMVMVRLRRGLDIDHLADVFGVSSATASRYCNTWIEFLFKELSFLIKWPTRDQIRASLPKSFKKFKKNNCCY